MKTIIFNHKSYLDYEEIVKYKKEIESIKIKNINLVLMPSISYLSLFKNSKVVIGAQNFYSYNQGSYTGEINLETLKDLNVKYTLVGHPERIIFALDSYEQIKDKLFKSLNSGFNTTLCIGHDSKLSTIKKELKYYLKGIEEDNLKNLIIGYEPINKIESDNVDLDDIKNKISFLKQYFKKHYNQDVKIIYGGGLNQKNVQEVLEITDGIIIGKKSTDIKFIKKILN